jgi:hypothetical protein
MQAATVMFLVFTASFASNSPCVIIHAGLRGGSVAACWHIQINGNSLICHE